MGAASKFRSALTPLSVALAATFCLTSCSQWNSWNRSYNLRQWEKVWVSAESSFMEGDYARAEEQLRAALNYAQALGEGGFRMVVTLDSLGKDLVVQGKMDAARRSYEQCLSLLDVALKQAKMEMERSFLQDERLLVLTSIGNLCLQTNDLASAQIYFEQALSLCEQYKDLADSHTMAQEFGKAMLGMTQLKIKQGDAAAAAKFCKLALASPAAERYSFALRERLERLSTESSKAGATVAKLESVDATNRYREAMLAGKEADQKKDYAESIKQYELAVQYGLKQSADDQQMFAAYQSLGKAQEFQRLFEKADASYKASLAYREKAFPVAGDESTDWLLTKLAVLEHGRHDEVGARAYALRQLKLRKQCLGDHSTDVADCLARLSEIDLWLNKNSDAKREAAQALAIAEQNDWEKGRALIAYDTVARVFFALGQYKDARAVNDKILSMTRVTKHKNYRRPQAMYRLAALEAQEGGSPAAAVNNASIEMASFEDMELRLKLLVAMCDETAILTQQGQLKGAAVMASGSVVLANQSTTVDSGWMQSKADALAILSDAVRKLGNSKLADSLKADADKLRAGGKLTTGN